MTDFLIKTSTTTTTTTKECKADNFRYIQNAFTSIIISFNYSVLAYYKQKKSGYTG